MGEKLGLSDMPLSFIRHFLGVESRSGLPQNRIPNSFESWGLAPVELGGRAIASSDLLHAPARSRAPQILS